MDVASIAQVVSAVGTVGLTVLFGFQLRAFHRQVLVNRDTLNEMREARVSHERPQVLVTAEYRHGTLVEVVISNIGRGDAKNVTFEFSAPIESSVSYRRDSEVVPLSELPHFRDGLNFLAAGAEITSVWDYHANLVPLLREMELQEGITVTSRYDDLTGEPYETTWTINPLLIPGGLYATETGTLDG
ncbi:MAG: hypothetical protein AVDCRST_MAG14-2371 [uncultured Rubrobacteraceae bacterium]|uniref:Uncharacterized protein n=1 Tax=uncultured Rubrobacteraceae bacterium TaxID=349277 RepID=A0A6J4R8R6_9ACTN|nr:MAG: hypothetical protein AVDCRST_MAG14-2371 [uncultured Rubrobacteraceae bacterium]